MKKLSMVFIIFSFLLRAPLHAADKNAMRIATQNLIDAAGIGELEMVKKALGENANINGRALPLPDMQDTALGRAIANKHPQIVTYLLSYKPDLEISDTVFGTNKGTPLALAAYHNNLQAVNELIAHKADVNRIIDAHRFSPLFFALISPKDNREIIQILLKSGAHAHKAIYDNQILEYNPDIFAEALPFLDKNNSTINLTVLFNIKQLLTYRFPAENFNTLAHIAILNLYPNVLQFLIDQGVRLDIPNGKGDTLLTMKPKPELLNVSDKQQRKINANKWQAIQNMLKEYVAKLDRYREIEALKKELGDIAHLPGPLQTLVIESEVGALTPGQKEYLRKKVSKIPVPTQRMIIEHLDGLVTAIKSNNAKKIQAQVQEIRQKELVSNIVNQAEVEFPDYFKQIEKLFADAEKKPSESSDKKD